MTHGQRKALTAVRRRTWEQVLAARTGDVEEFELEELGRIQARAARRALRMGCNVDAVIAAQKAAQYAVLSGGTAEVA